MGLFDSMRRAIGLQDSDPTAEQVKNYLNERTEINPENEIQGTRQIQDSRDDLEVRLKEPLNPYVMAVILEEEGQDLLNDDVAEDADRLESTVVGELGDGCCIYTMAVNELEGSGASRQRLDSGQFSQQGIHLGSREKILGEDVMNDNSYGELNALGRYFEVMSQIPEVDKPEAGSGDEYVREIEVDGENRYEVGVSKFGPGSNYHTERVHEREDVHSAITELREAKLGKVGEYLAQKGLVGS